MKEVWNNKNSRPNWFNFCASQKSHLITIKISNVCIVYFGKTYKLKCHTILQIATFYFSN